MHLSCLDWKGVLRLKGLEYSRLMHYIKSLTIIYTTPLYTQLTNQIYYFTRFPEKTYVVCIARISHWAFTRLLDRWCTNSFSGDICWTQMDLGSWHNKASNNILASKCQLTTVFVGERRQITSLYKFSQNPECLAVWEDKLKNLVLSKFNTVDLLTGAVLLSRVCYF